MPPFSLCPVNPYAVFSLAHEVSLAGTAGTRTASNWPCVKTPKRHWPSTDRVPILKGLLGAGFATPATRQSWVSSSAGRRHCTTQKHFPTSSQLSEGCETTPASQHPSHRGLAWPPEGTTSFKFYVSAQKFMENVPLVTEEFLV